MNRSNPKNCWEVKNCGREQGGEKAAELGVCQAAIADNWDGTNGGKNGGRICWAIAGTLCGGKVQGIFAMKIESCVQCEFFRDVVEEEGRSFAMYPDDQDTPEKQGPPVEMVHDCVSDQEHDPKKTKSS